MEYAPIDVDGIQLMVNGERVSLTGATRQALADAVKTTQQQEKACVHPEDLLCGIVLLPHKVNNDVNYASVILSANDITYDKILFATRVAKHTLNSI